MKKKTKMPVDLFLNDLKKIFLNCELKALNKDLQMEDGEKAMQQLSIWLINPSYTETIAEIMKPWLLEILGWAKILVGNANDNKNFDIKAHAALCVCLAKLLEKGNEIKIFISSYFKDFPPPYFGVEDEKIESITKKMKMSYTVPDVTTVSLLEASLSLLRNCDIQKHWDSKLLQCLSHKDENIRWLACQCLGILCHMSEVQQIRLSSIHCSKQYHLERVLPCLSKQSSILNQKKASKSLTKIHQKFTHSVGKVLLPIENKNNVKEGNLIELKSTQDNLESISLAISLRKPILIEGVVGSGKTSLVEHLAALTGRPSAPEFSKVQLSDQTDSKTLLRTYRCTANPGEFIKQPGALTEAVTKGYWLLLEDIDFAPTDVISLLIPLLESRILPGHENIVAHPNFQIFVTRRTLPGGGSTRIGSSNIVKQLPWTKISLSNLSQNEIETLIRTKWPELSPIASKLTEVYLVLSYGQHSKMNLFESCAQCLSTEYTAAKTSGRFVSVRDLMKWCSRVVSYINEPDLDLRAFREALDCFCAAVPDADKRFNLAVHIGSHLNLSGAIVTYYLNEYKPEINNTESTFSIGPRCQLKKRKKLFSLTSKESVTFSKTRLSSCLLEQSAVAVMNMEPVLIVGETGTGKTSTVQYLANMTNNTLRVINMNQQSDSADLLGGFKPVEMRTIVTPLRQEFEELFHQSYSVKKNFQFLKNIMTLFSQNKWRELFKLMKCLMKKAHEKLVNENNALESKINLLQLKDGKKVSKEEKSLVIESRKELKNVKSILKQWKDFQFHLKTVVDQVKRIQSALAFSFIEGTFVKAIQKGEWVLLDEINLASADALECLSGLLDGVSGSLTLHERGDSKPITRHPNFRLFACMNPATDVGKQELPVGLRNRFTEFFMEEFNDKDDLMLLVRDYLLEWNPSAKLLDGIISFYFNARRLAKNNLNDGTGHKPHFTLRTLCRALGVAKKNPCENFKRSLYEAFCLSFLTQLDRSSYPIVINSIKEKISGKNVSTDVPIPCPGNKTDFVHINNFWIPIGDQTPVDNPKYVITNTVELNLKDLVRIVSIGGFPVLLQGDTSVGKTSLISYLAQRTGNTCVRINNHQHTDLQEYVGCYAPDDSGKLVFKEGVLVQAMKKGHWIILDELNLAPSDVLEALNRLLDDNRELFIPEMETTIKAHPRFMLFATQNPPGVYGGRQVLSRAFRNRFVELHFDLIPAVELVTILHRRCEIPESYCKKMIAVLQDLQKIRRGSNLFQGKQSFVTLRDLFRWAERYRLAPEPDTPTHDWLQHIADEGYLVMAGRMRVKSEAEAIKQALEKRFKKKVDSNTLFDLSPESSYVTKSILESLHSVQGFEHIVWTRDMRRLYVLVAKALYFSEPILLVGDTGCGKTTVCQMIATLKKQRLFTVNCHMHTEGADFLGGLRPVRNRSSNEADKDRLFEWVDGPLIQSMKSGGMFLADEISLADDSVLERLNSVLEPERTLVLSEKGISEDGQNISSPDIVVAEVDFRLIGTMNPGGDYGKKELSPALRNRMTEIWCPKVEIARSPDDIKKIICHNIDKIPLCQDLYTIEEAMLSFLTHFIKTDLGKKCVISLRDILSWVFFINKLKKESPKLDIGLCYVHGACLVLLDSLGSGATGSTVLNWQKTKDRCMQLLCTQAKALNGQELDTSTLSELKVDSLTLVDNESHFGIDPFLIPKGRNKVTESSVFSFKAPRTCLNLLRLLRGLQLSRPILLEGSPGVGKTSLVMALAKASGNDIVRINLSEQTDVSDLFGADLPEEGSKGGVFAWRDGPLLQALKNGAWIVLDELNLASQSVLEGLNACFDHRGEIYVSELNRTFTVQHKLTKIFACQNPQFEGGARKGLPKSFLNRFTQVHIQPLSSGDLAFILGSMYSDLPNTIINKMIQFNERLCHEILVEKSWGVQGGPWELNLRDLFRWSEIMLKHQKITELNPGEFVQIIYADRMRKQEDKDEILRVFKSVFGPEFPVYQKSGKFLINENTVRFGRASISRSLDGWQKSTIQSSNLYVMHNQTPFLETILNCVNMNWMTILVGGSSEGKSSIIHILAELSGRKLLTLSVNSQMDVTELLGGFDQADYGRVINETLEVLEEILWKEVRNCLLTEQNSQVEQLMEFHKAVLTVWNCKRKRTTSQEAAHFIDVCEHVGRFINQLKMVPKCDNSHLEELGDSVNKLSAKISESGTISGGGTFEWVDSPLIKAVRDGHWLLIDGVNLCSASVLDRLNGLLEPNGVLTVSERGVIDGSVPIIKPHKDFRIFLTMDPQNGEISRAMRNRGVEVCMTGMWSHPMDVRSLFLSKGLSDETLQYTLSQVHVAVCNDLPAYEQPSMAVASNAATLINQLLQLGLTPYDALQKALLLTYAKQFGKDRVNKMAESAVTRFLKKIDKKSLVSKNTKIDTNCMMLSVESSQNNSICAFSAQMLSLMKCVQRSERDKINALTSLFPDEFPKSLNAFYIGCFASTPLRQWDIYFSFANACKENNLLPMKAVFANILESCKELQKMDETLPADPRFCLEGMKSPQREIADSHLPNKVLLGLSIIINNTHDKEKRDGGNQNRNVLQLSKAIGMKEISSRKQLHPSLKFLYPLLEKISDLCLGLANDLEIPLSDSEYFDLKEGLLWRQRLAKLCEEYVNNENIHIFLPRLVYHWQQLNDHLLTFLSVRCQTIIPESLTLCISQLKAIFESHCSPVHFLVPSFRSNIDHPHPYINEEAAEIDRNIADIAQLMMPHRDNHAQNSFVSSKTAQEQKMKLAKCLLESQDEDCDSENMNSLLDEIKNEVISAKASKGASTNYASTIQLWPLIDYLVYKQLSIKNATDGSFVNCISSLAKASCMPVNCASADSCAAVALYLYGINNCSSVLPTGWLNYHFDLEEMSITECDRSNWWEGESNFVLNPVGCLLSYQLLTGFTVPDKEIFEISLGDHSEREKQLNLIRSSLFSNWNQLSDPLYSHEKLFEETVLKFVSRLIESLLSTLNFVKNDDRSNSQLNTFEKLKIARELIQDSDKYLTSVGSKLLDNLFNQGLLVEKSSMDLEEMTKLAIYAGLFQSWMLSHTEQLDPAQQKNLLVSYHKGELNSIKESLLIFKWISHLRFNNTKSSQHPHVAIYENRSQELNHEIQSLSQDIAYRPDPPQYVKIAQEINHFMSTVFSPDKVGSLMTGLLCKKGKELDIFILQCEGAMTSCDKFISQMFTSYVPYRDLTTPLLHGITLTCQSIRNLMVLVKNKDLSCSMNGKLDDTLGRLLTFPTTRTFDNPSHSMEQIMVDQKNLSKLLVSCSSNESFFISSQSLDLRASMYDVYNMAVAEKRVSLHVYVHLTELIDKIIIWWREQEELKKKKKEEEESLYRYKAKTLAACETEEEEIEREYNELFPNFDHEFEEFNEPESMLVDGENDDEDQEDIPPSMSKEKEELKLSDAHLSELIECHKLLTSLAEVPWMSSSTEDLESKTVTPIILRSQQVQLLMRSVGPNASFKVDENAIGALIIANHATCASVTEPFNLSVIKKEYNFYQEPNLKESLKIRPILESLSNRIYELLEEWPEHPTLILITKVVSRVLEFPVSSPLIRLVLGLEIINDKIDIWNKYAHKGVSLWNHTAKIVEQIFEWRKLELDSWKSCLSMVSRKVSSEAQKFWPHLYDSFTTISADKVEEIIQPLKQFIESALVGDYEQRLELLLAFHCHLNLCDGHLSQSEIAFKKLVNITWNFYQYYLQFLPIIQAHIASSLKPIAKEVKDFNKIIRYKPKDKIKDITIEAVRALVTKSKNQIHKYMRNWEKILREPSSTLLLDSKIKCTELLQQGEWDQKEIRTTLPNYVPERVAVQSITGADASSYVSRLDKLSIKCSDFIAIISSKLSYKSHIEDLEDFTGQIIATYQGLVLSSEKADNIKEKPIRMKQFKAIIHQKRECLSNLFKSLSFIGVSYSKGNSLFTDEDLNTCLLVSPISLSTDKNINSLKSSSEAYFYKSIGRCSLLLQSLNKAHEDLGPDLIRRLRGSSCHLLLLARKVRETIPEIVNHMNDIDLMLSEINKSCASFFPDYAGLVHYWNQFHSYAANLSLIVSEELALLHAYCEEEPLVIIEPNTFSLNSLKVEDAIPILKESLQDLKSITMITSQNSKSFNNSKSFRLSNEANILELHRAVDKLSFVSQNVEKALELLDPERLNKTCLTKNLKEWSASFENLEAEYQQWELDLEPLNESSYQHSENVESCVTKMLLGIEGLFKKYESKPIASEGEESDEQIKLMLTECIINSIVSDFDKLRVEEVNATLQLVVFDLKNNINPSALTALKLIYPLLKLYKSVCDNMVSILFASSRSINKLLSVLLGIYQQMATKGFCKPQDYEEQTGEGEGATSFEDSGPGLADGEGKTDVSERFESEDQLESGLQKGDKEEPGNQDIVEEDGGIEMSDDFDGKLQNVERKDGDDSDDNKEEEEDQDFDKQMGEIEKGSEKLDEKLWADEEEKMEGEDEGREEEAEEGPGESQTTESEIVANDDNKNKKEVDKKEKRDKKELEFMEEDLREQQEEEEEEEGHGDNFKDNLGGEDKKEPENPQDDMEIPENLNLDNNENEASDHESESEFNPEIEIHACFPEEEKEKSEKENDEDDTTNGEKDEGEVKDDATKEDAPEETDNKEDGDVKDKTKMGEDNSEEVEEKKPEEESDITNSKDSKEGAQADVNETNDASKDKTKNLPDTADGAQPNEDEEIRQEEQGQMGEKTEDQTGVGQSDSKTREEAHSGMTSKLMSEEEAKQKLNEENRPRKPGDVDSSKTLGDVMKEIHQGLMTKHASKEKEKRKEQIKNAEDEVEEQQPEGRDADLYEHVGQADDHYDKQTTDAGTQEEARLKPAPIEHEKDEDAEAEGVQEEFMEVDEETLPEEESNEKQKRKLADTEGNVGNDIKRFREDKMNEDTDKDYDMLLEGDDILEMTAERPMKNDHFTLVEEANVAAAMFSEDLAGTRDKILEAGDGDNVTGIEQWSLTEGRVTSLALQLCEELRLILEPTEASKLKGDFRTGKRLNMRKVIDYIASQFRKDKIWLRRTQPSKRSYHVQMAIDDSLSMQEVNAGELARESVALVAKALTLLEVGQVGIMSFGTETKILHPFHEPFSDQSGAKVFANLKFDQSKSNFAKMLEDSIALFASARGGTNCRPDIAQLLLIVSDGQTQTHSKAVRAAVRAAREAKVFVVFLVLDAPGNESSFYETLVYNDGVITNAYEMFPFPFFLVVRDFEGLPDAIATALRQWFELVTANAC